MKCNRIAVYGWKSKYTKKSNPRILLSVLSLDGINPEVYKTWIISHSEVCNGEIESRISLESVPYYGGNNPAIEVLFRCNKCGYNHAGENDLPDCIEDLNEFLTKIIKNL